jgi:hypothetical protein
MRMRDSLFHPKILGIVSIIFGVTGLVGFFWGGVDQMVIPTSDIFLVKYSIIIAVTTGGLYFIVLGIFIYRGILKSYYSGRPNYEKAKTDLFTGLFSIPFVISLNFIIYAIANNFFWKLLGLLMIVYCCWSIYSNVRILRNRNHGENRD